MINPWYLRLSRVLLLISCAWLVVSLFVLVQFAASQNQYHFGTEIGSWRYSSVGHYVGAAVFEMIACLLVIFFEFRSNRTGATLLIQVVLMVALLLTILLV